MTERQETALQSAWTPTNGCLIYRNWCTYDNDFAKDAVPLADLVFARYEELFGYDSVFGEPCVIINEKSDDYPMLVTNRDPIEIALDTGAGKIGQIVYQFSHEMMHYVLRQNRSDKAPALSWFEEPLCEAMSRYMVKYAAENWRRCALSETMPDKQKELLDYLEANQEADSSATDELAACKTVEQLRKYEINRVSENRRSSHIRERNLLYKTICEDPALLSEIVHYRTHLRPDKITLDLEAWAAAAPDRYAPLFDALREIQPIQ